MSNINLLFSAILMFTTPVFACPDLSGSHFVILKGDHREPVSILVRNEQGVTVYDTGPFGGILVADGKKRMESEGQIHRMKAAHCVGSSLVVAQVTMQFNEDGSLKCNTSANWTLRLNEKGKLKFSQRIKYNTCLI